MTDDERTAILAEARDNIERLENFQPSEPRGEARAWQRPEPPEPERRRRAEPEPPQRPPTGDEIEAWHRQWDRWVKAHIAREREFMLDVLGSWIAEERKRIRTEAKALVEEAVNQLRLELTLKRDDDSFDKVIDLPPLPRRQRHEAA